MTASAGPTTPSRPVRWRRRAAVALGVLGALGAAFWVVFGGGSHSGPGTVYPGRLPAREVAARGESQRVARAAVGEASPRQILFGDLHVHTTFSADAFLRSIPVLHGEGAHPPADACDYARFCSGLDFFALTDHAESLTPTHWTESLDSVRQCNAAAGDPADPDLVAFAGFEWTQVGRTPSEHYGHKNVIFRDTDDAHLPTRPIAAGGPLQQALRGRGALNARTATLPVVDFAERRRYLDVLHFVRENRAVPACPPGVDVRLLPRDCRETAATPRELFDKLDQWGFDALVIPHGMTWGYYTPAGYRYASHLTREQTDPRREFLMEVYSGHGNSEEYRSFHEVEYDANGGMVCPAPRRDYEPCCHRAGELIRARCGTLSSAECERRVRDAQQQDLAGGVSGFRTVVGAAMEDWGDCGQCRDCFDPSFNYRPGGSAQSILASADFSDPAGPRYPSWGFLASSDNHSARPGTGYKEMARRDLTETTGARDEAWREALLGPPPGNDPVPRPVTEHDRDTAAGWQMIETERGASYFLTGGLVAVHSEGRTRAAIWDALQRREVYGTSGERILLWFDLLNGPSGTVPMGGHAVLPSAPRFSVRAVGSPVQLPGCPSGREGPPADRLARLCRNECNNPSSERRRITRIEVVRIRPQVRADEPVGGLIEDPWRTLPCSGDPAGCQVTFDDPEGVPGARRALYYVRAIQEPTPAVNAGALRCERDAEGRCVRMHACYGDYRTPWNDDCLAPNEERAWSSPIEVRVVAP